MEVSTKRAQIEWRHLITSKARIICQIKNITSKLARTAKLNSIRNSLTRLCTYSIDSMRIPLSKLLKPKQKNLTGMPSITHRAVVMNTWMVKEFTFWGVREIVLVGISALWAYHPTYPTRLLMRMSLFCKFDNQADFSINTNETY